MDVLAPTDRVEKFIMALPQSFGRTLNDPLTQSLAMAVLGLLSFGLMGVGLFWPNAYSHVSALHLLIRAGLLTGLCAYVYHELILKRCGSGSSGARNAAKLHADSDADADAADVAPAADAAAGLKPRRRLAPVAEGAEPAAAAAAVAPVAAAEERPQRHDDPLPEWLRANAELCGAESKFAPLPVPAPRRANSLLFDALNHNGMLTSAYAFVHRSFFAAPAKAARAAAVAATTDPVAAAAAGDAAAAAAAPAAAGADAKLSEGAAAGAAEEYPEVVGVFGVGEKVCGHPAIVHGGMTATLLDQVLGIATFVALPKRMCFTANLNMNYRKPLPAGTKVAVRARATKIDGRKLHATGRVELLGDPNTVFADANALFIMPK